MRDRIAGLLRRGSDDPPVPLELLPTFVAAPVPEGWTEAEVRTLLAGFALDDNPPGHLEAYVADAFYRFLHTWGLVRDERGKVLELGSNPYFMSFLLQKFTALDVHLANYFGPEYGNGPFSQQVSWTDRDGTRQSEKVASDMFNIETDRFPYPDGSFDVVLFCEIIEHLLEDPLHALREIHRILRPGGILVVTTPNVARLGNVLALIAGTGIYDPYSGYGPYGRHNREYTLHELVQLLRFCGYEMERHFTADAHVVDYTSERGYAAAQSALEFRKQDLGQYLFVACRAAGPPRPGRPESLFRSYPQEELVAGW